MKDFIDQLASQCKAEDVPIISNNTVRFLQDFLSNHTIKHYAELGTAQGYSTIIAADILQKQGTHIRTREISYPQYKKALSHFSCYGYSGITAYYADATTTAWRKITKNKFDVVFVDAQKSKYHELLKSIRSYVTDDGFIIIDDVIKFKQKMISLYHRLDENNIEYTVHHLDDDDGIIVIQKKK